jgi:hypothetical protein
LLILLATEKVNACVNSVTVNSVTMVTEFTVTEFTDAGFEAHSSLKFHYYCSLKSNAQSCFTEQHAAVIAANTCTDNYV